MTSIEEADTWIGRTALDSGGEQIGSITQIWVDDSSGQPEWASVKVIGLLGREALVPLAGAVAFGGGRRFGYSKADIVEAPEAGEDGRFDVADKERLIAYYGSPGTDLDPGATTWIDRLEDAADGATVREITALQGGDPHPAPQAAPAPEAPAAPPRRRARLFGRSTASSTS